MHPLPPLEVTYTTTLRASAVFYALRDYDMAFAARLDGLGSEDEDDNEDGGACSEAEDSSDEGWDWEEEETEETEEWEDTEEGSGGCSSSR